MESNPNQNKQPINPNPNDPRFLRNQQQNHNQQRPQPQVNYRGPNPQMNYRNPPPQYPNQVYQNNLTTPFLLDQSLPSTSVNYENNNFPPGYNNDQYILDMDKLYQGFENPILHRQNKVKQSNPNRPVGTNKNLNQIPEKKEQEKTENEDETLVEIIQDIEETKKPIEKKQPEPVPQNNYQPNLNRNINVQNRINQQPYYPVPNNNMIPQPNRHRNNVSNSQKSINKSIQRHCQIYKLDKKKPIFFNCHQCKNKIKSVVIQE